MKYVETLLWFASGFGLAATLRMLISIAATAWYAGRHQMVEDIKNWSCNEFHDIMSAPRPWYVKWDDTLTRRHL